VDGGAPGGTSISRTCTHAVRSTPSAWTLGFSRRRRSDSLPSKQSLPEICAPCERLLTACTAQRPWHMSCSQSQERIKRRAERPQPGTDPAIAAHPSCTHNPVPAHEAAGDRSAHAASSVQQTPQPQPTSSLGSSQAMVLASAIDAAVASCQVAGALPQAQYAASSAGPPTPKQRKRLLRDVR
jgi:hypothetical protein